MAETESRFQNGVVVVGGGAAGMIAAWRSASLGVPTLVLEKKGRLGTKILISGGGKCNVTHAGTMDSIRQKFRPDEGRFLRPSFYRFTNEHYLRLLHDGGMETYTRPDGRIFPVPPQDAKDVVAVMEDALHRAGVRVWHDASVVRVLVEDEQVTGVELADGRQVLCRRLIVATGGSSYPATGTTGDGWRWMESLGHTLVPLRAALAPLYLEPTPPAEWSGVALRDVVLKARRMTEGGVGKELMRWRGDMLWTHKGVSGPTALGVSREVAEIIPAQSRVEVDLCPDTPHDQLSQALIAFTKANPRRPVTDAMEATVADLPARLVRPVFEAARLDPVTRGAYLGQKERNRLADTLKAWPLGLVRNVPLERGEVVAGGVALSDVEPQTMRSHKIGGLYLCGEVLDIAGPVGGYNLQAAWSTGYVAGETAAKDTQSGAEVKALTPCA